MGAVWTRWGHLFVLALVVPLALSSALPIFARVLGGPTLHVCHCAVSGGHSTCGCPICNPDRDDLKLNEVSLLSFGATLGSAVTAPAGVTIVPPDVTVATRPGVPHRLTPVFLTPPTPPPRLALS